MTCLMNAFVPMLIPSKNRNLYEKKNPVNFNRSERSEPQSLYGVSSVRQALLEQKRNCRKLVLKQGYQTSDRLNEIREIALTQRIPIEVLDTSQLDQLVSHAPHQGVVLVCGPLPYGDATALNTRRTNGLWVALDQLEDPQNIGAIIRSCGFFQIEGVIVPQAHFPGITPSAAKTSAGVSEFLPIILVPNLARFLDQQKQLNHYWIVGLDMEGAQPMTAQRLDRPTILVVGNEGKGLRPLVKEQCDWLVQIEGNPQVESLNVSTATAIALYQFTRG